MVVEEINKIPYEVIKPFIYRTKKYETGDLFLLIPKYRDHKRILLMNKIKEKDINDCVLICNTKTLDIGEKIYNRNEIIPNEHNDFLKRHIRLGRVLKKLKTEINSIAKDNEKKDKENKNKIKITNYVSLAKKYNLEYRNLRKIIEDEFNIKIKAPLDNIEKENIQKYDDYINEFVSLK